MIETTLQVMHLLFDKRQAVISKSIQILIERFSHSNPFVENNVISSKNINNLMTVFIRLIAIMEISQSLTYLGLEFFELIAKYGIFFNHVLYGGFPYSLMLLATGLMGKLADSLLFKEFKPHAQRVISAIFSKGNLFF